MIKKICLLMVTIACLAFAAPVYAQDPGIQDSIIIGSVYVDTSARFVGVPLYVETDDSVGFYHMAIHYATVDTLIRPRWPHTYFPPITEWGDGCDTVYWDEQYFDFCRICEEDDPPLYTHGRRIQIMTIAFNIGRGVSPQLIVLDTTWNPRNLSTMFGLIDGVTEFIPAIQPGFIAIGPGVGVGEEEQIPQAFNLSQNYPNPFNPSTNIEFSLIDGNEASLVIYDLLGRQVKTLLQGNLEAGSYSITWDGRNECGIDAPSGTYFYRLMAGDNTKTKRMTLIR